MAGMLSAIGENAMVPPPLLSPPSAAAESVLSPEPASPPSAAEVSPPHAARNVRLPTAIAARAIRRGLEVAYMESPGCRGGQGATCAVGHTKHRRRAIQNPDRRDAR